MSQKWQRSKVSKDNKLIPLRLSRGEPWHRSFLTLAATGLSRLLRLFRDQGQKPQPPTA
jgi:hypothetical protein